MTSAISTTNTTTNTTRGTKSKFNLKRLIFALVVSFGIFMINFDTQFISIYIASFTGIAYFVAIGKIMKNKIKKADFIFFIFAVGLGIYYGIREGETLSAALNFGITGVGSLCAAGWVFGGNMINEALKDLKLIKN